MPRSGARGIQVAVWREEDTGEDSVHVEDREAAQKLEEIAGIARDRRHRRNRETYHGGAETRRKLGLSWELMSSLASKRERLRMSGKRCFVGETEKRVSRRPERR